MDWRDISQYTRYAAWRADIPWKYLEKTIKDYEIDHDLLFVPDFQRGHVWTQEQQTKYIEYRLKGGQTAKEVYFNHPGWQRDFRGSMVLVDGLQRITAVRKFMNNEIRAFDFLYNEFSGRFNLLIGFVFFVNNLRTYKEVLQWYIDMNEGGIVHSREEIERVKGMIKDES